MGDHNEGSGSGDGQSSGGGVEGGKVTIVDDSECDPDSKYEEVGECEGVKDCEKGTWFVGQWGSCSAQKCSEGEGIMRRKVVCVKDGMQAAPDACDEEGLPWKRRAVQPIAQGRKRPGAEGGEAPEAQGGCKAFYDDFWIFGEEGENKTATRPPEESDGSGGAEGSGPNEMTREELQAIFGEPRCMPEPVEPCANSTFGCCPDNFHSASGPFNEGCAEVKSCEDTRYGCCMDSVSVAHGRNFEGCPPSRCEDTL